MDPVTSILYLFHVTLSALTEEKVFPTYEDVILTYQILLLTYRQVIK